MYQLKSTQGNLHLLKALTCRAVIVGLAVVTILAGCDSDSDTTGPGDTETTPADFSGNWTIDGEVIAKRACDNEVGTMRTWDAVIT